MLNSICMNIPTHIQGFIQAKVKENYLELEDNYKFFYDFLQTKESSKVTRMQFINDNKAYITPRDCRWILLF